MIKKKAQIAGVWPQIYNKLRSPPPGVNLGSFPSRLPPQQQVTFDTSSPADNANAVAYVSSGDANNDGKIDKIHIVVPKLEQQLNSMGINPSNISDKENLSKLLMAFVEILSHEMGHMKDFSPQGGNVFPGGEGVADSAARQAIQEISVQATNIHNKFEKLSFSSRRFKMLNTVKVLTKLANDLDSKGEHKLADDVDSVLQKMAQGMTGFDPVYEGAGPLGAPTDEQIKEIRPQPQMAGQRPKNPSILRLQVLLGIPKTGIWDGPTQKGWQNFALTNIEKIKYLAGATLYDGDHAETLLKGVQYNWKTTADTFGLRGTPSGAVEFIEKVQVTTVPSGEGRSLMTGEAPAEATRPTRGFMGASGPSGSFDVDRHSQITPQSSDKSKKIKKEAAKKPSLEQVLNTSFSAPTRKPFNR